MPLKEIIIDLIKKEGPISFHDFMEMALYYPELGYYTSLGEKIGKKGDYYTSSYLTAAFGAMIGRQLEAMWTALGKKEFTIVEYGAGTGFLCHDLLDYLKNNRAFYDQLRYCIIEKSPAMREKEKSHLHEKVSWYDCIRDIGEINGCILSNELIDNFPVHQVLMQHQLMEVFVDYQDDFEELYRPANKTLSNYFTELAVHLTAGFRTEINLDAIAWIKEISRHLNRGYVLTIDYGYPSEELYRSYRSQGTLVCYHDHQVNELPYAHIGEQDITAHVNFSALIYWGEKNGLQGRLFTDQAHFLRALGIDRYLEETMKQQGGNKINDAGLAFLKQNLLVDMGSKFKVLIQQKGLGQDGLGTFGRDHL